MCKLPIIPEPKKCIVFGCEPIKQERGDQPDWGTLCVVRFDDTRPIEKFKKGNWFVCCWFRFEKNGGVPMEAMCVMVETWESH